MGYDLRLSTRINVLMAMNRMQEPMTAGSAIFRRRNKVNVPRRFWSRVMGPARPVLIGRPPRQEALWRGPGQVSFLQCRETGRFSVFRDHAVWSW